MNAQVISFPSIVAGRHPAPTGPTCGCPRHELDALVDRLQEQLDTTQGELLVDRQRLAEIVDDVANTTRRLLEPKRGAR